MGVVVKVDCSIIFIWVTLLPVGGEFYYSTYVYSLISGILWLVSMIFTFPEWVWLGVCMVRVFCPGLIWFICCSSRGY